MSRMDQAAAAAPLFPEGLPGELEGFRGVLPMAVPRVGRGGRDVVLAVFEPAPRARAALCGSAPLPLRAALVLVDTSHGPVVVLLWVLEPPGGPVRVLHDHQLDPWDRGALALYRRLARQRVWAVHVLDERGRATCVFDGVAVAGLGEALDDVVEAAGPATARDFARARDEVARDHTHEALARLAAAHAVSGGAAEELERVVAELRTALRRKDVERVRQIGEALVEAGGLVRLEAAFDAFVACCPRSRTGRALLSVTWRGLGGWAR
ncbi:MAG: hypothetical protein KC635_28750 [Myxococcales bacterium]|nr:hypothetical protein [Myxococcales bacterium]